MHGTSPLISSVLIVVAVMVSTFIVMGVLTPTLERYKEVAILNSGKNALTALDKAIREVALESTGAKRVLTIQTIGGKFRIIKDADLIQFATPLRTTILEPGTVSREHNLIVACSPKIEAYEGDANNDGYEDLVLKSDVMIFAVRKLYNESDWGEINLSRDTLFYIENRVLGVNVTPVLKLLVNGIDASYGNGYTKLITPGKVEEGIIKLYLNTTLGKFEIYFYLIGAQDFVRAYVKDKSGVAKNVTLSLAYSIQGISNDYACVDNYTDTGTYTSSNITKYFVATYDTSLDNATFGMVFVGGEFAAIELAKNASDYVLNLTQSARDNEFLLVATKNGCSRISSVLTDEHWVGAYFYDFSNATSCNAIIDLRYKDIDIIGYEEIEANLFDVTITKNETPTESQIILKRR